MKHISISLLVSLLLVACGKSDKAKGGDKAVTGGCLNQTAGDCWEHPAGGDAVTLADICDNDPGAKWVDACPREKLAGGCKRNNSLDRGAPTHFFYNRTADDVKKECAAGGQLFVEK